MHVSYARDGALWVFDKPSGMTVYKTPEVPGLDLLGWARQHAGAPRSLAPIHRLDRHTSGVLLASEDPAERAALGRYFASGTVSKRYLALVHGQTDDDGVVDRPLLDNRRGRKLPATTHYEVLQRFSAFSYLALRPQTGRKHQLRRHLRGLKHSIVGDPRYGPPRPVPVPADPGRLWLHAERLELPDGRIFEAELPAALADHLLALAHHERGD